MTRKQAGGLSSNPGFYNQNDSGRRYHRNCQSCVVSYAMRLRGYDVEARGWNPSNDAQVQLANDSTLAWIDPISGKHPMLTTIPANDETEGLKWLRDKIEHNSVYIFEFGWKGCDLYHIIIVEHDGTSLGLYDPQSGKVFNNNKQMGYMKSITWKSGIEPRILRIDQLEPDLEIVNAILKPKVKK